MKRPAMFAFALVLLACPRSTTTTAPRLPGAVSPRAAVEQFLAGVRAQDLQAVSDVWGRKDGLARNSMDRKEHDQRVLIMQCYFAHDRFRIAGESDAPDAERVFRVELSRGSTTRATNFFTTQGPNARWFVRGADIESVKDLRCGGTP